MLRICLISTLVLLFGFVFVAVSFSSETGPTAPNLCFETAYADWMTVDETSFMDLKRMCDQGHNDAWVTGYYCHPDNGVLHVCPLGSSGAAGSQASLVVAGSGGSGGNGSGGSGSGGNGSGGSGSGGNGGRNTASVNTAPDTSSGSNYDFQLFIGLDMRRNFYATYEECLKGATMNAPSATLRQACRG